MNPSIFKAYDIRGLCPGDFVPADAYAIGQAFVKFSGAKNVVVGRDARETSPEIFVELVRGIRSQGADVVDIGLVSTPMFYFAIGEYPAHDAGVMVTASHNPKEYNGLKLCLGDVMPVGATTGMDKVRDLALAGPYPELPAGRKSELDIRDAYLDRVFSGMDVGRIRPLKVVVDCGNGMAGVAVVDFFRRLPQCEAEILYGEPDGRFPNHEANPVKVETLEVLRRRVVETRADLGIAFDGDADRVGFVDELGEPIRGDLMHALLAGRAAAREPGAVVGYAVNETLAIAEEVERLGGRAVMHPVGHGLVKPLMRREGLVFAGEISMHYYYRDFYGAECTDLTVLLVMEALSESGRALSEIIAPLCRYWHSGEINLEVADKDAAFARLEGKYAPDAQDVARFDGLRMAFRDWWWSVRASHTEPLLRVTLEAKTKEMLEEKREELLDVIRG